MNKYGLSSAQTREVVDAGERGGMTITKKLLSALEYLGHRSCYGDILENTPLLNIALPPSLPPSLC